MADVLVTYDLPNATSTQRDAFNDALVNTKRWRKLGELTTAWKVVLQDGSSDDGMRKEVLKDLTAAKKAATGLKRFVYAAGIGGTVTHAAG